MISIYVLPTEAGQPSRAIVGEFEQGDLESGSVMGAMATWSTDMGTWTIGGSPVPRELADAITEHARELGVEAFLQK